MSTQDYSKLKNADLESMLKQRGLTHTGRKADLIARLVEADKTSTSSSVPTSRAAPISTTDARPSVADDEIDWDDVPTAATSAPAAADAPSAPSMMGSTAPATAALAAGGITRVKNPRAVPNQTPAIDPATTDDLTVAAAPTTSASTSTTPTVAAGSTKTTKAVISPAEDAHKEDTFSRHLPATSAADELAKRAARAAKFGTTTVESKGSEDKLARAKRFGLDAVEIGASASAEPKTVKGLDEALPERRERRGKKRGAEDVSAREMNAAASDTNKRRGDGGRAAAPARNGETAKPAASAKSAPTAKTVGGGVRAWMSEEDRKKAEARKARFGAPQSAAVSS